MAPTKSAKAKPAAAKPPAARPAPSKGTPAKPGKGGGGSEMSLPDQLPQRPESTPPASSDGGRPEVRVEPRPYRYKKSRLLQSILKPKTPIRKRYFTAGVQVTDDNQRDYTKEPSPYCYPKDMEEFAHRVVNKAWRNDIRTKEFKMSCSKRPSYQNRQRLDLLNRLYVKEPIVESMKTVLDIDPDFYNIVEGRPIPDKVNVREYIETVRESLRIKIINGYREDDIMLIDESLRLEQKKIDQITRNYQTYVNAFEEFLSRDHYTAMQLLKESENEANAAYDKYEELKGIAKKFGALQSQLYNSEEKWRNCKAYQKFLYTVSPLTWRMAHKHKKPDEAEGADTQDDEELYGPTRGSVGQKVPSLSDILKQFREECKADQPPELFFTEPDQLMEVFRFMETTNLNSLLHSEELAVPLDHVKEGMRTAEELFDKEIRALKETIDKLESGISWEEERALHLENLGLKLINEEFKALIMDDSVLNLHVFVEDVYETRIGPNDANLSISEMMKGIENKYRSELLSLDMVPSDQVAMLEGTCYREEMMVMRFAEKAAKQFLELERLTLSLNKAFAPPYQKPICKPMKPRSPPVNPPKKIKPPPRALTEKEEEYLEYFTDYCRYTDKSWQYGILTEDQDEDESTGGEMLAANYYDTIMGADAQKYGKRDSESMAEKLIMLN